MKHNRFFTFRIIAIFLVLFVSGVMEESCQDSNVNEQGYGPPHTPACAYEGCP